MPITVLQRAYILTYAWIDEDDLAVLLTFLDLANVFADEISLSDNGNDR